MSTTEIKVKTKVIPIYNPNGSHLPSGYIIIKTVKK